jgi:hypothetical protein
MFPLPRRVAPKQQGLVRRPVRSRMDAAAELTRLEYERARLERVLGELDDKRAKALAKHATVAKRAAWLHAYLDASAAEAGSSPAQADQSQIVHVTVTVPSPVHAKTKTSVRQAQ